jgi:hypothetical protein
VRPRTPPAWRRLRVLRAPQDSRAHIVWAAQTTILLGIEDVTDRRAFEREREELLHKQQALLSELERGLNALPRTQFDGRHPTFGSNP